MFLIVVINAECKNLGRAPASDAALSNLKLLILLLLGCAVQGPTKEAFICRIKELDIDVQHEIVACIKQVISAYRLASSHQYDLNVNP